MARMAVIVLILGICLPDVLPARMVLKAGEIDSGKVRVGAFAEVVYGKGKRDPVSGEWEKLARVSGYIKAVDAESLTLALRQGLGKKRIAFAHIQKLLLAKSSREVGRLKAESSGMVLKAGEIDSGKVRVGAFAEVVYGQGARDPVSGSGRSWIRQVAILKPWMRRALPLEDVFGRSGLHLCVFKSCFSQSPAARWAGSERRQIWSCLLRERTPGTGGRKAGAFAFTPEVWRKGSSPGFTGRQGTACSLRGGFARNDLRPSRSRIFPGSKSTNTASPTPRKAPSSVLQ